MGTCVCTGRTTRVIPVVTIGIEQERRKLALAERLIQLKRLDEAPELHISKSQLYQLRMKFKKETRSDETVGSGLGNSSGSLC